MNTICQDPTGCEATDAIVDLIIAFGEYKKGGTAELPLRKTCEKCQSVIESLLKRRMTAKI